MKWRTIVGRDLVNHLRSPRRYYDMTRTQPTTSEGKQIEWLTRPACSSGICFIVRPMLVCVVFFCCCCCLLLFFTRMYQILQYL